MASAPQEKKLGAEAPGASGPLALVAMYPGVALAAIAVLVALLAVALSRGTAPPGRARAERPEGDPEIEALIVAVNAPA
jgi:hypothetical protein